MFVFVVKNRPPTQCLICCEEASPIRLFCSHVICLNCLGEMVTLADREQLYAHHLRCPEVKCRKIIPTEILSSNGLLTEKLKSLHDNSLYKPPSQGAPEQDLDKDFLDLLKVKEMSLCTCGHAIERLSGCNHMICRCGRHFCYKCNTTLSAKNSTCTKCFRPAVPAPAPQIVNTVPAPARLRCRFCGVTQSKKRHDFTHDTLYQHMMDKHGL